MRKGAIVLATVAVLASLFTLSLWGSSQALAQQDTPTVTATCDLLTAMDSVSALMKPSALDTKNLEALRQARDIIDAQLSACNFPTETPTASETKEGTLTVNEARTATRSAVNDMRTATSTVKTATASFIAAYKTIARGELASYADKHIGEKVKIQGRVFNVIDDQDIQIFLPDGVTAVYVTSVTPFTGIYENDYVTVYGTIAGFFTGQNTMGGTIKQPQIAADLIAK